MKRLSAVSLFSGAMGLDLGLEAAGFNVLMGADNFQAAIATIKANRPALPVHEGDIRELSAKDVRRISGLGSQPLDLLAGGPPCQSFSTAGKRLGGDGDEGPLAFEFVRLVGELRPRAFLMENVRGFLSASLQWRKLPYNNNGKRIDEHHGSVHREFVSQLVELGYSVEHRILQAADYGVPQTRERVFFIGYRDGRKPTFPAPTHAQTPSLFEVPWKTLGDALNGLAHDDSHCTQFSERKLRYLRMVPAGGNWRALPVNVQKESMGRAFHAKGGRCGYWRRLAFKRPCPTVLTEPQNASTSLCHPTADRPLSVRECARAQTFSDEWRFEGRGSEQYRLVGNAVPPVLATALARSVASTLRGSAESRRRPVDGILALGG